MAFGAVRRAYKAPARFFADDPTAANQILWYYVPDDREVYDDWTVFWPRVDVPPNEATSAFEKEGTGRACRTFKLYTGNDVYGFPGDHVHGTPEDFRGLTTRKSYFVGDVPPPEPCEGAGVFVRFALWLDVVDVVEEGVFCPCCPDELLPTNFTVTTDSADIPFLSGLEVGLEFFPIDEDVCEWTAHVEDVDGGTLDIAVTSQVEDGPHHLHWGMTWTGIEENWEASGVITPDGLQCVPWAFDSTGIIAHNTVIVPGSFRIFTGTLQKVSIGLAMGLAVVDSSERIPLGLALKLDVLGGDELPIETIAISLAMLLDVPAVETIPILLAFKINAVGGPLPTEILGIGIGFSLDAVDP